LPGPGSVEDQGFPVRTVQRRKYEKKDGRGLTHDPPPRDGVESIVERPHTDVQRAKVQSVRQIKNEASQQ
jgi:hypothetical protein